MKGILMVIVMFLSGCALFNKTSKTGADSAHSSSRQLESSQLLLKKVDKETQIFTYWNDSGYYQFQYIKEQVDQAKSGNLKAEEKQAAKYNSSTKKVEPAVSWRYIGIIAVFCFVVAGFYLLKYR